MSDPVPAPPAAPRSHEAVRRAVDVLVAVVVLAAFAPLLGLLAWLIRRGSAGPAIFRQTRAGKDGAPFTLYKFRTMRIDADPYGASPHSGEDPRLTRLGRLLREWSLDELPQLWNLLRGDMTLVGPRPLYVSQISEWDERQRLRLRVKPGLTGLSQVRGRAGLTMEQKLELDLQYVLNRSLRLDFLIHWETMKQLFRRKGIYEVRYSREDVERKPILRIGEPELALIRASDNAVLLGIIMRDGRVLVTTGSQKMPGHREWVRRENILEAVRGFSLMVKHGRVIALYRASTLNDPQKHRVLEQYFTAALREIIPLAADFFQLYD